MWELVNYWLLENLGMELYRITDKVEQYLDGKVDVEELEAKDENR